ncbi:MAG: methionine/alanine import family NSS transporter small subunit [bacterium]|nr:methionine/alanine import family NSS transporter small subunit [bacterium]
MNGSAIFMMIFIGGIVWGGFILALIAGIKNEKSKKTDK